MENFTLAFMPTKNHSRFKNIVRKATTLLECGGFSRHGFTIHNFYISLDGNITALNCQGMKDGDEINVIVKQDSTGGRTVAWGSMWQFAPSEPTVTATAGVASIIRGMYCGAIGKIIAVYDTGAAISASASPSVSPSPSTSASLSRSLSPSPSPSSSVSPSTSVSVSRSASASQSPSASNSPSSSTSPSASQSPSSSASASISRSPSAST